MPADQDKTRDYGSPPTVERADEAPLIATFSVVLLMAFALGRRGAVVVLVAVPVTLALTLASSYIRLHQPVTPC